MRPQLFSLSKLVVLAALAFSVDSASAQTTAVGPYYATPSWDQKIACSSPTNCPRFVVLSNWNNEAVLDRETGLVWQRTPLTKLFTHWLEANNQCAGGDNGGRLGWRLPTIQDLASLVDRGAAGAPFLPAGHPFKSVQSAVYWSATTDAELTSSARTLDFQAGVVTTDDKVNNHFVWCVRGGQGVDPQ